MDELNNQQRVRSVTDGVEEKYGLPKGLLYKMAGTESSFTADAVSPKGANGWFQFMPDTAKRFGVTDPTNLEQSAEGAGKYMAHNMKTYGDLSHALADYNGGPKAVNALKMGKPWKETAGYLNKILGPDAGGQRGANLSPELTGGYVDPATAGISATKLAADKAREDRISTLGRITDLPEAVSLGFQNNNSVYNFWQTKTLEDMGPPSDLSEKDAVEFLKGIPIENQDYILQGTSNAERQARRARSLEAIENSKKLDGMGWAGTAGNLASTLVDLPTLAMFVPGINEVGMVSTAGRLGNAVRSGLAWGAINGGYEALSYQDRPLGTTHDVKMAVAMGIGMGALTGALHVPKGPLAGENQALKDMGNKIVKEGHIEELKQAGLEIDPAYKAFLLKIEGQSTAALKDIKQGLSEWTLRDMGIVPKDTNVPVAHIENPGFKGLGGELPKGEKPAIKPEAGKAELPPAGLKTEPTVDPVTGRTFEPSDHGDRLNLVLKGNSIESLAADMRANSKNPALVAVLDRLLAVIDVKKVGFSIISKGKAALRSAGDHNFAATSARGMVSTPRGSTGEGISMYLRDTNYGLGKHGMGEETFVHELVHVAAVKAQIAATSPNGVVMSSAMRRAALGMKELHTTIVDAAKSQFGAGWKSELSNRLGVNLQNERELIAYGLTNKAFQDFLKTVRVEGSNKSMWDKFVTSIRGLLGIAEGEHNALTKLIDLASPLLEKNGLSRKVKKDFEIKQGGISVDDMDAANAAGISEVYGWGLGLEHRLGTKSVPQAIREEAAKLFGTTVGYKDHSVVGQHAWGMTTQLSDSWSVKMRKPAYAQFENWFKQSGIPRSGKGKAFEDFGTEVSNYVRGVEKEYPAQVTKAGDVVRKLLAEVNDHINNPGMSRGGKTLGLTETIVKDPVSGIESIVGTLAKNDNYLPRNHDITKWANFQNQFTREAMEGWWARAYQSGREGISDEAAAKWAGWYTKTVDEAGQKRMQESFSGLLQGADKEALKDSLIRNGGYDEAGAYAIINDMFPRQGTDKGALQSSLKHRNTIDERYTETMTDSKGNSVSVGINDFTHSNAFDLMEPYLRRTAGSVALAEHLGIYKAGDILKRIDAATENALGPNRRPDAVNKKFQDDLKFAYDRIQGIPQEDTTKFNKAMEMWRSFNVIRLMGGAVWNQTTEMSQIVGTMGWKAMAEAMPELKALTRDIATGKAPSELLEHLENTIGGAGSEYVKRMDFKLSDDWVRNWGDTAWNRRLDKLDDVTKRTARGTLDYTGMTPVMIQQKRLHATALVNHFINDATGARVSTFLSKERLAHMGLDDAGFSSVKEALSKYSTPTKGEYSMTHKLDFDKWVKEDPKSHSQFMEAIHRESRRVIQENDLASMIPIMGTTLGQTAFQFMNFTLHGWNKSLMFAMNHKDYSTLSTVMHGGLFGTLAYMGRTMVSTIGMDDLQKQEFLDKRMALKQIIANGLGRTAQASLLPQLHDSTLGNLWGAQFSGMRTTSSISSLGSNPTIQAVDSVLSLGKIMKNSFSSETQTSQQDIKNWGKLVPLNNVAPISTLLNAIANDYPKSSTQ